MHGQYEDYNIGKKGAGVGIWANAALFIFKLLAGVFGKSYAMMADALHTATDFLTSIGVFIGFKIAQKPADADHPYGHGRAESIAAKLVSLALILGGLKVAYNSISVMLLQNARTPGIIAFWAAIISIVVKEWMFRYTYALAEKIGSSSLKADAWHHRTDALSSIAALIGIAGAMWRYPALDSLAGFAVSIFVIKAGLRLFHKAYEELMDAALPLDMINRITGLAYNVEGVKKVKDVKGRKMGIDILVDMVIEVDKGLSVEDSHVITAKIRRDVLKGLRGAKEILIHVEPYKI